MSTQERNLVNTKELFQNAQTLADELGHEYVTTDHLFYVLCSNAEVNSDLVELFKSMNVDLSSVIAAVYTALKTSDTFTKAKEGTPARPTIGYYNFYETVRKMAMLQQLPENGAVSVSNLLTELLFQEGTHAEYHLEQEDISVDDILMHIEEEQHSNIPPNENEEGRSMSPFSTAPSKTAKPGETLKKYCTNLTQEAKDGKLDKLIGRELEIQDIAQILSRRSKNNAILVGEAGVGKTQIVEGLALAIAKGKVPASLKNKQIMTLNVGDIVAGAKFRGDFEIRIKQILEDLKEEHILFIDEIHTMMGAGAGSDSNLDMANLMKPKLSRGEISVIGATTYDEYRKHFVKDQALSRRFLKIDVKEPTADETRKILVGLKPIFEKQHNVAYNKDCIDAIMSMSEKYIHNRFWPDKAIDLMDAAGARNMVAKTPKTEIGVEEIAYEVTRVANIPAEALIKSEAVRMKDLKKNLETTVFGQDEAINKLNDSVLVARAGLRGKDSTQGSYLFVGPSGCGKTEVAKALATSLNCKLVRFDMSEYSEQHTVSRMVGSPPGYVGHGESEGELIEAITKTPDCVLLLDEVEKAHPDVFNLFLQVLDEGHLTSLASGKSVKFNNVTVIMTTNLGSKNAKVQGIGYADKKQDDGIDKAVKQYFRPEFLNRIDGIVKFNTLEEPVLKNIAKKFIKEVNDNTKANNVQVKLDTKAIQWLVTQGKDDAMGARPMKRLITEHVKKPLAGEILFGRFVDGGTASFTVVDDKLVLQD